MGRNCNDPLVTYLKEMGYNAVRHPRANLRPLQLLVDAGRGDLDYFGELTDVFDSPDDLELPKVETDSPSGALSGQTTGTLGAGIGITLLGSIIGAMGGGTLGLKASYKSAKAITFTFKDVLVDAANVAQLDTFLAQSQVDPFGTSAARFLEADDVYVITDTAKSATIDVHAESQQGRSLGVDVPVINDAVGGNIDVSTDGSRDSAVTFSGGTPLVFGFQAVRLFYQDGRFTTLKPQGTGTVALRTFRAAPTRGVDGGDVEILTSDEVLIGISGL